MVLGVGVKGYELAPSGVGEDDIETGLLLSNDRKESVEIVQIRHVALNARDVLSDFPHSVVEISLSACRRPVMKT